MVDFSPTAKIASLRRQSNFHVALEDANRAPMTIKWRSRHQGITRTTSLESEPVIMEARWRYRRRLTRASITDVGTVGPKRRLSSITARSGSECDFEEMRQRVNLRRSVKDKHRVSYW
jgi:hypothetical protein